MEKLFIAEKPDIAKAIRDFLWKSTSDYKLIRGDKAGTGYFTDGKTGVSWAMGHILGLANPEVYDESFRSTWNKYPIFPEKWILVPRSDTKEQLEIIGKLLKETKEVVHAGDADREGQLLIDEILKYFKYDGHVLRIFINAKDDVSMQRAFDHIEENSKYEPLYYAGVARAKSDWLVGMNLSRAYTKSVQKAGYFTSQYRFRIGRVKMPTLALVVNREREIKDFRSIPFYDLMANFRKDGKLIKCHFIPDENVIDLDPEGRILNKDRLLQIIKEIEGQKPVITEVTTKKCSVSPPLPHSLDTLQVTVNKRYGYSPAETLKIVQSMYEKKLVTYPRSDCNYLPLSQKDDAKTILKNLQECGFVHEADHADVSIISSCFNDKKVSVHTAIIPTMVPIKESDLSAEEKDVYHMIAMQYCLQFYPNYDYTKITFKVKVGNYMFKGSGIDVINLGYKRIFNDFSEIDEKNEELNGVLPPLIKNDILQSSSYNIENKRTTPPKRFTEGTLLAAMANIYRFVDKNNPNREKLKEVKGIGTPATRATIVEELQLIKIKGHPVFPYIKKSNKSLIPTDYGFFTIDHIGDSLTKPDTTAEMEYKLTKIANGEANPTDILHEIEDMVKKEISYAESVKFPKPEGTECPICHNGVLIGFKRKDGVKIYRCTDDDCKSPFTQKSVYYEDKDGKPLIEFCPKCDSKYPIFRGYSKKTNRYFWFCPSCETYFNDKNGKVDSTPHSSQKKQERTADSIDCPICHKGFLARYVNKQTQKPFYVCSENDCKYEGYKKYYREKNNKPEIYFCTKCKDFPLSFIDKKGTWVCSKCHTWYDDENGPILQKNRT